MTRFPSHMPHLVERDGLVTLRCSCGAIGATMVAGKQSDASLRRDGYAHVSSMMYGGEVNVNAEQAAQDSAGHGLELAIG